MSSQKKSKSSPMRPTVRPISVGINGTEIKLLPITNCSIGTSAHTLGISASPLPFGASDPGALPENKHSSIALGKQYEEKVRPCIDLIDSLRSLGVEKDLGLPAIAVIGDQSSGKSSVLEALSGVALPRGSGIVTRCPLVLKLKKVKVGQPWKGRLTYKESDVELKSPSEVEKEVSTAQNVIAGNGVGISDEMINLEIQSSDVPDLTLIDLPGIARVAIKDQPRDIGDRIKGMIRRFIQKQETINLVVVPCTADIATTEALKMAKEVDPLGERTLGILTKPDLVDEGTEENIISIVHNIVIPLKKGYMIVKCRGQKDINEQQTLADAIEKEKAFFEDHPHFRSLLDSKKATIHFLAERLTKELVEHISKSLPHLQYQIEQKLLKTTNDLKKVGEGAPQDEKQLLTFLIEKIRRFNDALSEVTRAEESVEPEEGRLFTKIRKEFVKWKQHLDKKANKLEDHLRDEVEEYSRTYRGRELPGFVNYKTFEVIVKQHIEDTKEPALHVLKNVTEIIHSAITTFATNHFQAFPNLLRATKVYVEDLREHEEKISIEMVRHQFEMEKMVYSQDCLYSYELNTTKRKPVFPSTNADLREMAYHVNAYFKIASDRLANQIPLIIQFHMMEQYINRLQTSMLALIGNNGETKMARLLYENKDITDSRLALQNRIERLRKAQQHLSKYVVIF
ncbi:interferon-induced GTP-binding protein Mx-like isoform X2 [Lepisosteus oculatus]|uniref:interferon-induced GTP-binding protein Mx-like isoform X2 n=1 Tax=Lepisosteus oculatus TaxID=7918 RepID=UPI0007402F89|nr:PREDICTED: interferon-induced GTP-binding protein Mx-like isoform X2 [Lepisosteus oculatus]